MAYWLVKTEPESFGWEQQVKNGVEPWTGVRNFTARTNLKTMQKGDRAFFYHSGATKEIVGVVEVVREAYPDPTAKEGPWVCVDVKTVGRGNHRIWGWTGSIWRRRSKIWASPTAGLSPAKLLG